MCVNNGQRVTRTPKPLAGEPLYRQNSPRLLPEESSRHRSADLSRVQPRDARARASERGARGVRGGERSVRPRASGQATPKLRAFAQRLCRRGAPPILTPRVPPAGSRLACAACASQQHPAPGPPAPRGGLGRRNWGWVVGESVCTEHLLF